MQNKPAPRLSWIGLATIWFGGMISVPSLLIGSTLIAGLTFYDTLLAGFIGFSLVCVFMSLESVAAVDRRLDTVALATSAFGQRGAKVVVGLALGVSLLGWFGVQSGIAGGSFAKIANLSFGWALSASVASFVLGLFMMLTAVFGFKYLRLLNFVAVCPASCCWWAMRWWSPSRPRASTWSPSTSQRLVRGWTCSPPSACRLASSRWVV